MQSVQNYSSNLRFMSSLQIIVDLLKKGGANVFLSVIKVAGSWNPSYDRMRVDCFARKPRFLPKRGRGTIGHPVQPPILKAALAQRQNASAQIIYAT